MAAIEVFQRDEWAVEVIDIDGEPWFTARSLTDSLGFSNSSDAITRHVDPEDKGVAKHDTPGGAQNVTVVSESGMYALTMRSNLPAAKAMRRWVTSEVLPSIRRTGAYVSEPQPMTAVEALRTALDHAERAEVAEARIAELEPAAQAWQTVVSAEGDLSVGEAAQLLQRDQITIGRQRLFAELRALGWSMRDGKNWRPMQAHGMTGTARLSEIVGTYTDLEGVAHISTQLRVTTKGFEELRRLFLARRDREEMAQLNRKDTA